MLHAREIDGEFAEFERGLQNCFGSNVLRSKYLQRKLNRFNRYYRFGNHTVHLSDCTFRTSSAVICDDLRLQI